MRRKPCWLSPTLHREEMSCGHTQHRPQEDARGQNPEWLKTHAKNEIHDIFGSWHIQTRSNWASLFFGDDFGIIPMAQSGGGGRWADGLGGRKGGWRMGGKVGKQQGKGGSGGIQGSGKWECWGGVMVVGYGEWW